jgi:hypothetical protein
LVKNGVRHGLQSTDKDKCTIRKLIFHCGGISGLRFGIRGNLVKKCADVFKKLEIFHKIYKYFDRQREIWKRKS